MDTAEQSNNKPWLYKKGQSGNPSGRPKGTISLKTYVRNKLLGMSEEEKEDFIDSLPKTELWKMAEGNPDNKVVAEVKQTEFTPEEIEAAKQIIVKRLNTNITSGITGESK